MSVSRPDRALVSFFARGKILITGGTGFLGSALTHSLVRSLGVEPARIRVFYLPDTPANSLNDLRGLDLCPGNVLRPQDVRRACEGMNYVFHMAASTSFDPRHKRSQWLVNVEGTRNVLESVRESASIQRLCYTSSVNALGVPRPVGSLGRLESSDPYAGKPRLHAFRSSEETLDFIEGARSGRIPRWERRLGLGYFDSKLAAQELVQRYVRDFGLNVVSVLPGTCFGPYDDFVGNGVYLLRIYDGRMPGVLKGGLSTAHVTDVVEGHVLAMSKGHQGERYIITGRPEDNLHFQDLTRTIAEVLRERFPAREVKTPSRIVPSGLALLAAVGLEGFAALAHRPNLLTRAVVRAGSVPLFYSCEDARGDLGYEPQRTFRQAVEDMADYYRAIHILN